MVESNTCSNKSARSLRSHTASRTDILNAMYFASAVLKATKVHFLLHQETMEDPKVKQHSKVLFMSTALPSLRVNIFLPYHINSGSISQTMSNCASQVSQHMLHSNPVCLSQLTHKLAKCTHCIANIWSGVNQIHQLSNQLYVQSLINFVRIRRRHLVSSNSPPWCSHGLQVQHPTLLQYLNYVLPLTQEDLISSLPNL
jgi:hypothetical protein